MNRINSSRSIIAAKQRNCNYRPSGAIARHVRVALVEDDATDTVTSRVADTDMVVGRVAVNAGDAYFLVATKWMGLFYVVVEGGEGYHCSSSEETVCIRLIGQVKAFKALQVEQEEMARRLEEERLAKAATFAALREQYDVRAEEARLATAGANYLLCDAQAEEALEEARFNASSASFRIEKRDATSRYSRAFFVYWYVQRVDDLGQWHDILSADGRDYLLAETEAGARRCLKEEYGIEGVVVVEQPIPPRHYGAMVGGNTCWHTLRISASTPTMV